jgi:hypothetical protein
MQPDVKWRSRAGPIAGGFAVAVPHAAVAATVNVNSDRNIPVKVTLSNLQPQANPKFSQVVETLLFLGPVSP